MPSHIVTVFRPSAPSKELIAKKVRKGSHELEIFELLGSLQPKSNHVISLIDSFHGQSTHWVILPKMSSVDYYMEIAPQTLESKVIQVCFGLIEGLAYLHEHHIAHRDIKPDNLLVDRNFYLKIIDFDIAIRVKDEDEEVDDCCGTKTWMAPEVEMKLRHSPIKADRWACGHVVLFLLDEFRKEDNHLRAFARKLTAHYPKQRPSLLEWCSHSTPALLEVGNVRKAGESKAWRVQQDPVEVGGENTMSPKAKKQRLDG
jgi:serine/threonine protein kinase